MTTTATDPVASDDSFDPVASQIVYNYELTVNREMGRAVLNLSGSPLFVGASDFACGCLDAEGNILTSIAWSLQMGYAVSNTVRESLRRFGDDIHDGDMIFCNDPYEGGGLHSPDVVVVAPVFHDGELMMWVGVSAHITDVGGAVPGGFSVEPMECYGENVRFTPVKFYKKGDYQQEIVDAFLTNVRLPERSGIDLKAIMGATWIGRERMEALIASQGPERIKAIHAGQLDQSDRAVRERLRSFPDGVYYGAAHMEHDGAEDKIYTIRARVIKEGEHLTVDFSDTDPQAPGVLNSAEVGSMGNVVAATATVLVPDVPYNQGMFRSIEVVSPRGTLVNAIKPAPISGATIYGAWFGTDAILEAVNYMLAGSEEGSGRRSGPWGSWTFAWQHCTNQYGQPWFFNIFTSGCGGASAMPTRDGEPAMMGIQTVDAFTANIEDYELQSPVLFLQRGFAPDTGGAGRYRGGLALESFAVPWQTEIWNSTVFHNRLTAPSSAVSGGFPGAGSAILFARDVMDDVRDTWERGAEPALERYISSAEAPPTRAKGWSVGKDDGYYLRATGGPGYGDPLDRPIDEVAEDLRTGAITTKTAKEAYGIVTDQDGRPNQVESESLREKLRSERKSLAKTAEAAPDLTDDGQPGDPDLRLPDLEVRALSEYLQVSGDGYECRRCGHRYCGVGDNWKWHAAFSQNPVSAEVIHSPIRPREQKDLVFRQYFCPGCGTQTDTEVSLATEAPRWNYQPLEVWRRHVAGGQGSS